MRRSSASTGAGRVAQARTSSGSPDEQERRHRQDQDATLEDQGRQRPVGGEVAERPAQGDQRPPTSAADEAEDPRPGATAQGGSARRCSRRWRRATPAPTAARTAQRTGWGCHAQAPTPAITVGPFRLGRRLAGMATPDRLERVTDLLLVLLDTNRPLSLREIAERVPGYPEGHDARRQAFERDKRLLRDEGVPVVTAQIEADEQVGYRVDPDAYYLPDLGLEPDEQAALNLAVAGVHLGEPIGREALSKLGMGGQWPRRGAPLPVVDLPLVDGLPALPVCSTRCAPAAVVDFAYRGEPRSVDVAGIRFRGGHWYAVGWDRDRGEARTFRVDRIEGCPSVGRAGSAALPDGFDADEVVRPRSLALRVGGRRRGRHGGRRGRGLPGGDRARSGRRSWSEPTTVAWSSDWW